MVPGPIPQGQGLPERRRNSPYSVLQNSSSAPAHWTDSLMMAMGQHLDPNDPMVSKLNIHVFDGQKMRYPPCLRLTKMGLSKLWSAKKDASWLMTTKGPKSAGSLKYVDPYLPDQDWLRLLIGFSEWKTLAKKRSTSLVDWRKMLSADG